MESKVQRVRRIGPNDRRYHLRDTSAQAFTMFTANTGYLQGGRDTQRHTRGYCSSRHHWHTLFGELRANHRQEKSNYAVNCLFLQLSLQAYLFEKVCDFKTGVVASIMGSISKGKPRAISLPLLGWRWGCFQILAKHEWRRGRLMI